MGERKTSSITELLVIACSHATPAPGRQPWQYGWFDSEYRHSTRAAVLGPDGPVKLDSEGLQNFETAATKLLGEKRIQDRWDSREFWGILASLVAASQAVADIASHVEENINLLRTIGPTLTVSLIANATWNRPPMTLGDSIIGDGGEEFLNFINISAGNRTKVNEAEAKRWLQEQIQPRVTEDSARPAAIACWSPGQSMLASRQAERELRNLVDLTILLENDLPSYEVYRRGPTNRPGLRGLALDRGALERGITHEARLELACFSLVIDSQEKYQKSVRWFNAEPLPLGDLLSQSYLSDAVQSCMNDDPVSSRIKVAARWFADAHYTLANDDAALALGIAMDALLTGKRALSGSAMADRFALLTENPQQRRRLAHSYLDFYGARSSVAHGGRSKKIDDNDFMEQYRKSIHWAAWRSLALRETFAPSTEENVDELFDDLRWGAKSWPLTESTSQG
jgi:Apea-like HEPN